MDDRLPAPVRWLLIANVGIFAVGALAGLMRFPLGGYLQFYGALIPELTWGHFQLWRLFTYMFLHGNVWHLLFNMLTLWMLGPQLCWRMGQERFVALYLVSGLVAGLGSIVFYRLAGQADMEIIGASGALFGLMLAFARFWPDQYFVIFFVFQVQARFAVWIFGAISLYFAMGPQTGIAHATHLFGIVGALLYFRFEERATGSWERLSTWKERKVVQKAVEELVNHEEFYDTRVDPILKKISKYGMESLSKQEKDVLERASRRKRPSNEVDLERWRRDNNR
jgi:membrane associated rhomboid family serine protease